MSASVSGLALAFADLKAAGYQFRTERLANKNFVYHLVATPKPQQLTLA
jgi:hypothetical protein